MKNEIIRFVFLGIALVVLPVSAERSKRTPQGWRDGLWGRELKIYNRKNQDTSTVPDLLEDNNSQYVNKNEPPVSKMVYPPFIGSQRTAVGFLRIQNRKNQS